MKIQASESILKIKNPSTEQFLEIWKQYQPFLIEGVAEHWDACHKWSNDYLIDQCGDNIIPVRFYTKSFFNDFHNFACEGGDYDTLEKKMKYKEYVKGYVEHIKNQNNNSNLLGCYLPQAYFEERFPEIIADIAYPQYLNRKPIVFLWQGFSSNNFSSTTNLHFDGFHNIFAQVRGRKRILLFPPSNYLSFYPPLEKSIGIPEFSKVNPDVLNLELFPKFPWQEKIEIILQPGEMLYIPPFWWHYVTAVDENISLSFFYDIKMGDIFRQKNMISTILNIAPYFLYHAISSPRTFKNFMSFIKGKLVDDRLPG
ncbi:cupin-like domain-containing protein [Dendronalium sp. ChiSLP03b]|uniref:cupin-like domain-containing protein n=1 Tax=Dendronalium sp. ChiSLP03b TaxID=3075381 RepID=UPI002AD46C93|nr:cupin-like domain-containing protein [Dendronalium sp. ChiSLP03b]MDZ8206594.1 cupin-like domain-containing protein [Dendronalium sp. ChiSLP03b]